MYNKNKLYLILDADTNNVEYTLHVPEDEDIYVLRRSKSNSWSEHVQDQVILTVFDSGNGFRIKWEEKPNKLLDYSQIVELTIMLNFINGVSRMPNKYTFVDADDIVELV